MNADNRLSQAVRFCFRNLLLSAFVIFSCAVILAQEPSPVKPPNPWYFDKDIISALASVLAIIISVIAIFVSSRQTSVQRRREKREELRNIIEKLVSLREEFNSKYAKTLDVYERQNLSINSNNKRSIYIHAAELLIEELKEDVSSPEYYIIGYENELDSDFRQARYYYELADKVSAKSSLINQIVALRSLGSSYFWYEPYRDLSKGREVYEKAANLIGETQDPYLIFTKSLTYRLWADTEYWRASDLTESMNKLELAQENLQTIPSWFALKTEELRYIANLWKLLGNRFYTEKNIEKAQATFKKSLEAIKDLNDDNSSDIRGQIYQDWGYQKVRLDVDEGIRLLKNALQHYESLPESYPGKDMRIRFLHQTVSRLADEMNIEIKIKETPER